MSNWVIILHLDGTSDRAAQLLARAALAAHEWRELRDWRHRHIAMAKEDAAMGLQAV